MSMSKSVTSYLVGHVVRGIDGVDARVNTAYNKDSFYHDQKLINFLNMNTGDQKYIDEFEDGTSKLAHMKIEILQQPCAFTLTTKIQKNLRKDTIQWICHQLILNI